MSQQRKPGLPLQGRCEGFLDGKNGLGRIVDKKSTLLSLFFIFSFFYNYKITHKPSRKDA
jgi:hypothetical protein